MSLFPCKTTYKNHFLRNYTLVFLLLSFFSVFFGYSFDESVFSGYAANFYYYGANPFYYWGMGPYYLGIDIAGYFPSILINIVGIHNVLIEEFGVNREDEREATPPAEDIAVPEIVGIPWI